MRILGGLRHSLLLSLVLVGLASAGPAKADLVYLFEVDTSTIGGTSGYLDVAFNPADPSLSPPLRATVSGFQTDGTLGAVIDTQGDVSGDLAGTLSLENSTDFINESFQAFTFGDYLRFTVRFASNGTGGTPTECTIFGLSLYGADGTTPLLTADPSGAIATICANLQAPELPETFSPDGLSPSLASVTLVPEPSSILLGGIGLGALGVDQLARRARPARTAA